MMTKSLLALSLCLMTAHGIAQNFQTTNEADMQKMMQQGQQMQACMSAIDQSKLEALGERGRQVEAQIQALCTSGDRDNAQKTAMSFAMEVSSDPSLTAMRKCSEMMPAMMANMMPKIPYSDQKRDAANKHVCD